MSRVSKLEEHLKSCTVSVRCGKSQGTGFFIAQGRLVTSGHVLTNGAGAKVEVAWSGQTYPAEPVALKELPGTPPDVALLAVECPSNPAVILGTEVRLGDPLYCYGFTKDFPDGEPVTAVAEGVSAGPLLKLKFGQIVPGLSGAPILNLRTGAVCGVLKSTRDRDSALGGRGIPVETLLAVLPRERLRLKWSSRSRRLAAAGLIGALAAVSWFAWPALWHRILRTPVLVLPFSPPPALPDERPISDEIAQALTRRVREEAGLRPVFTDIARPIAGMLGIRGPCLPPDRLRQLRRSTGADFVVSGSFEIFHDKQPSKLTACFQSAAEGRKLGSHSYTLVEGEDEIEAAAADLADWVRGLSGRPSLSLWWNRSAPDEHAVRSYFEGVRHLQRFELTAAREKLESAVKRDGDFYPARRELSRLWQVLGNDGAALDEAQRALELLKRSGAGDAREESLLQAHLLTTQGEWSRAALLLQKAWDREPEAGEIAVRLAEAQNHGMSEQALLSIRTARERQGRGRLALTPELDANLDLEEATAYFWLGQSRQQLDAARRVLGKLLDLPDDRDQLISRARYFECIALTKLDEKSWPPGCDVAILRFRANGDLINEAKLLALLAGRIRKEDPHRAERLDRQALGVFRDEKFTRGEIDQATNLAYTLSDLGQLPEARNLCKKALNLARKQRSLNLPRVLTNCAWFNFIDHKLQPARDQYAEALALAGPRGDLAMKAVLLGNVAYLDHALGNLESALPSYEESLRVSREIGDLGWDYGETLVRSARLLLDRHREPEARARLREAWNCYLFEEGESSDLAKLLKSIDEVLPKKEAWTRMTAHELAGPRDRSACPAVEDLEPEPGAGTDA